MLTASDGLMREWTEGAPRAEWWKLGSRLSADGGRTFVFLEEPLARSLAASHLTGMALAALFSM
jgi:hypothetical protein